MTRIVLAAPPAMNLHRGHFYVSSTKELLHHLDGKLVRTFFRILMISETGVVETSIRLRADFL